MGERSGDKTKRGHNSGKLRQHRQERAFAAYKRQEARATRTDVQQLDLLLARPGFSRREKARLREAR